MTEQKQDAQEGMEPVADDEQAPEVADEAPAEAPFDDPTNELPEDEGEGDDAAS